MRTLKAERFLEYDEASAYLGKHASDSHFRDVVSNSTRVVDSDGGTIAILLDLPPAAGTLHKVCSKVKKHCSVSARSGGMVSRSLTFGAMPRRTLRQDYCSFSLSLKDDTESLNEFYRWSLFADNAVREEWPEAYDISKNEVGTVPNDWRLGDTIFTSGIFNNTASLTYHRDKGNFPNAVSAMFVFSRDVHGGLLSIPEYSIAFSFERPSLLIFRGQQLVHGVTPITAKTSLGHRFSVVYYAMKNLCKCGTLQEELERTREVRTKREQKKAKTLPKGVNDGQS